MPSILVVEDNPTTRKMLRLALVTEGYAVVEAADARAALAAVESTLPDLVLQDLILPDMDGLELLRRLRAFPGGTELPILALSGFLSRLEEAQTDREGFTALLVKPIEPSRLIEAIRVYLPQPPAVEISLGDGRRLLIVDDDPVQLKLTRIHFSELGFDVSAVSGASDALIAARNNRPDVILSDVFMPGTDGFDLCVEIRRDPTLANVPVVLLSAEYGSKADEDLARRVGANALILRTPDFGNVAPAIQQALERGAPTPAEQPSDQLALTHARLVIHQLERQAVATAGLSQRCGIQAGQLSLLSGVADALTHKSDPDVALRDVLAATLDAAGISKGALILRDESGVLTLRQDIGFSEAERSKLQKFFGHGALLEDIVNAGGSVAVPSSAIPDGTSRDILAAANITAAQIVPLISDGRGVGAMIIGATSKDVTSDDCVAFARAMGNQVVQSLALARSVASLSQERDRAQRYLDTAEVMILALDLEGRITLINRKGCRVLGWTEGELIGRDFIETCVPARIRDETREKLSNVHAGDDSIVENAIVTRTGDERLIEWRTSFQRDDEGRIVSTLSSGNDITERKHAVEALQTAEERMRFALQNANVGIWDMDYTTGVLRWSETIEAHYGVQPRTFGGTFAAFVERIHPDDRSSVLETVGTAMKSGGDFSLQHRSTWPDGTIRWLSGTGRILLGEHGEPVRGVGISLDVTERRMLEQQYQQAQKMEAVGTLAGGIAHDFNNILGAMLGCTELAAMDAGDNQAVLKNLAQISAAGRRATDLVQHILAFSGQQKHARQSIHLDSVVSEALALLRASLPASVELRSTFDPATPVVLADRTQVHQIVMNLGINAWHAIKDCPGVIEVALDAVDADIELIGNRTGRFARLSVRDTGRGMNAATQARIFEPFFTTKAPGEGTGLGLASVHGIVKSYDGEISVSSQLGEGTTFRIYIPATDLAVTDDRVGEGPLPRGDGQHVLFVDDEPSLVAWGIDVLERLGYRATGYASGVDALAAVRERAYRFDLVVTDMTMPVMTGVQFTQRLRDIRADLPVILTTGYSASATKAVDQFGIDAVLVKPIAVKTLAEAVDRALREDK